MVQPAEGRSSGDPEEAPVESRTSRMSRSTAANMIRSLVPLVAIILGLTYFCTPQDVDPVTEVDPTSSIEYAASVAETPILVPRPPEGWRPTSARTQASEDGQAGPVSLSIGYLAPDDEYAAFVYTDDAESAAAEELTTGATEDGTVEIDGSTWQRLTSAKGETLLVLEDGAVRVLITGSTADELLLDLAGSVRTYAGD